MKYEIGQFVVATKDEDRFIKKGALCKVINRELASCWVKDLSDNPYKKGTWWLKPCNMRPATKKEIKQYKNRAKPRVTDPNTLKGGDKVKIPKGLRDECGDKVAKGWATFTETSILGDALLCDAHDDIQALPYESLTGLRLKQAKPEPVERKYKVGDKAITFLVLTEESVTILVFNTDTHTFHKQQIDIEDIELLDD